METNKQEELYGGAANSLEFAEKVLENNRKHLKDVMKPAEKAAKELEKDTATEKVRLQGTKETDVPNLKPYTEAIDVKDRKECGKLIESAKREGRPWKVKRCNEEKEKQGYRYTFYTTKLNQIFTESLAEGEESKEELPPVEVEGELTIEEEKPMTFEEQMDFLAADEQEAIEGYEKIIAECEDEHVKEQLSIILAEEKAHKAFLKGVKEDRSLVYVDPGHEEEEEESEEPKEEEKPSEEVPADEMVELELDEASSAEKKAFKHGGEDFDDLITGKALARIKDPHERAMLLHQHRMEKAGHKMSDRPESGETLARHINNVERDFERKEQKMADAGMTEERELVETPIGLDSSEFVPEDEVSKVFTSKDGKTFAGIRRTPGKPAEMVIGGNDEETDNKVIANVSMDNPEQRKNRKAAANKAIVNSTKKEELDESANISLDDLKLFKPWGGAKDTWELILAQDKLEALDKALEDMYPEGIKASDLNDILWFEKDWIFDSVGVDPFIKQADAIEAEIEEPKVEETPEEPKEEHEEEK